MASFPFGRRQEGAFSDGEMQFGAETDTPFMTGSQLLVFELTASGGREYMHMHVRGLYRYVLQAITNRTDGDSDSKRNSANLPLPGTTNLGNANETAKQDNKSQPSRAEEIPPDRKIQRNPSIPHTGQHPQNQGQPQPITYRERLGGYLHPRDMRRLVTPFSASNEPELIVRRHVMLLNFDPLRAIVLRDRLLLLVPNGADSILVQIEQRVRLSTNENSIFDWEGSEESEQNHGSHHSQPDKARPVALKGNKRQLGKLLAKVPFVKSHNGKDTVTTETTFVNASDDMGLDDDDEWNEIEGREWIHLPFELQCAEAVLHVVSDILTKDTEELKATCDRYMRKVLEFSLKDDPLSVLRTVKDAVHLMTNRVNAFNHSLNRILSDEEDMALMNLSRLLTHPERFIQPVSQQVLDEESDEPELILESNLQIGLTLLNSLHLLHGQVTNAKELVDQKQDATRNRLLFANMLVSVFSLCTTLASLVGSFFGMNVPNPLERDGDAFYNIAYGSVGAAFALCLFIMAILWFSGTIPHTVKGPNLK